MKIPFVSFIPMEKELDSDLRAAFERVYTRSWYIEGAEDEAFEKSFAQFCEVKGCVGVGNGLDALMLSLKALGIKAGDEVIVPSNTYIATALAVTYVGAKPVFVEPDIRTFNINPEKIEDAITEKTKAIMPVHLYGQPCEMDPIMEIAKKYHLYVIEDCAQAHGALYEGRKVGSLGVMGCFSFYPGKNLFCFGEGGSVTSDNESYIDTINVLKNQGSRERYHHERVGYNMRLEGVNGAILSVGLSHLDEWTARRRELGRRYLEKITNPLITMQAHPDNTETVFHLFEITVEKRDEFIDYRKDNGIGCDNHYPVPCHLQEAYRSLGYREGDCPNAEYLAKHCVSLPMFPELTDEEQEYIIEKCNEFTP